MEQEILNQFSVFAHEWEEGGKKVLLNKKQIMKAVKYGDIEWGNEVLSTEDFLKTIKEFKEKHDNGKNSFFIVCNHTKIGIKIKICCLLDNGNMESKFTRR